MDENYYRGLIDLINANEQEMWNDSEDDNEGFEEFSKLWNILDDPETEVSAATFFDAVDICLNSFFGSIQDPKYVWESITNHYEAALSDPLAENEFRNAFLNFAEACAENPYIDCFPQFSRMMHLAISAKDPVMANAIINCAMWPEIWGNADSYPEWAVWFAVFSDKDFSEVPHTQETEATLNHLYFQLSDNPDLPRLQAFHSYYFGK